MSATVCWAIVPVKPLSAALGRLAETLGPTDRYALQAAMLRDVLRACARTPSLAGALVVTADPAAAAVAKDEAADLVADYSPPRGMNAAVRRGIAAAQDRGAAAALVLTADLPLIRAEDLETLARWPTGGGDVVLAPSRDGTGTNAMLLRPPSAIEPSLGPGSLARHLMAARAGGVDARTVRLPSAALDVDTPGDLAELARSTVPSLASAALEATRQEPATAGSAH